LDAPVSITSPCLTNRPTPLLDIYTARQIALLNRCLSAAVEALGVETGVDEAEAFVEGIVVDEVEDFEVVEEDLHLKVLLTRF